MDAAKYAGLGFETENKFDHGNREILTSGNRESQLKFPFESFPLLADTRGYFSSEVAHEFVDGIFRAGRRTGAFVRASIHVTRALGNPNAPDDEDEEFELNLE